MHKWEKIGRILALVGIPLCIIIFLLWTDFCLTVAQWMADYIFFCPLYDVTGLYCVGCGGTRAMMALLHGDILHSLQANPLSLGIVIVGVLWYGENLGILCNRPIKLIPRNVLFWNIVIAITLLWNLLRNLFPILQP